MTTAGAPARSRIEKSRPARTRVPKVANHSGLMKFTWTERSDPASGGPPGTSKPRVEPPLVIGTIAAYDARSTPATAAALSRTRSKIVSSVSGAMAPGRPPTVTASTRSASKPRSSVASAENERTNRPAATTSASDRPTCATTSVCPMTRRPDPSRLRPSRSASLASRRANSRGNLMPSEDRRQTEDEVIVGPEVAVRAVRVARRP